MSGVIYQRPRPSSDLVSMEGLVKSDRFIPASRLLDWIRSAILAEDGPLHNPEHAHLNDAVIGCLWTNCENSRQMRKIVGQAEMPANKGGTAGKWAKARSEQQLDGWFGEIPDFLITFDALYAEQAEDVNFCALVEHELYHCAQEIDEFGEPKFSKSTGLPKYAMRGHDVEEFVGVVRRYGIQAAGPEAVDMVIAAASLPVIGPAKIGESCGTCLRLVA